MGILVRYGRVKQLLWVFPDVLFDVEGRPLARDSGDLGSSPRHLCDLGHVTRSLWASVV